LEERELSKEEAASKGRKGREKTAKEIFLSETQKSSTTKLQDPLTNHETTESELKETRVITENVETTLNTRVDSAVKKTKGSEKLENKSIDETTNNENEPLEETTNDENEPLEVTTNDENELIRNQQHEPLEETTNNENEPLEETTNDENEPLEETTNDENEPLEETTNDENEPLEESTSDENEPINETNNYENEPINESTKDENEPLAETTLRDDNNPIEKDKKEPIDKTNVSKVSAATVLPQITTDLGVEAESENRKMNTWLGNMVKVLLEHMNRFGMCVVDDFLGNERGSVVLEEVKLLHTKQMFQDGQVMSGGGLHEPSIRSDKITWTDGKVPCNTPALRHLVKLLDSIVLTANKVPNNKEFGKYRINGRTHIMVACYPGGGTHYVKHVDNPNHDGRVVTAIYYLNKEWNSQFDGGSLKIYSQVNSGAVAKVDPVFDRVIFFWSDARNPHEVLPANRPRYAVTVWYLDEIEKQNYEKKKKIRRDDDLSPARRNPS